MQPKRSRNKRHQMHTLWSSVCPDLSLTCSSLHGSRDLAPLCLWLAKNFMRCAGCREQVLAQLLVLACDPGLAAAARMQQCLTVFFHAYAPQSAAAQGRLGAAALPAARRALLAGPTPAKSAAPQLLRYVLSLLQVERNHMPFLYSLPKDCGYNYRL